MPNSKFNFTRLFTVIAIASAVIFILLNLALRAQAVTGINRQINFQGKLVNNPTSTNVNDTSYTVVFTFYNAPSGGTVLWTETQSVSTKDGIFRVALGSVTPFPANFNFNWSGLYLGIKVNSDSEMTPRIQMAAVPFAFNSEKVAGLTVQDTSGNASTSGTLQIANGKTFNFGNNNLTFTTTGDTNLTLPTSGTLCTTITCLSTAISWWNQVGGAVFPTSSLYDFLVGGNSTASALFSFTGIQSGQTLASISGNLIVMPNNGFGGNVGIGTTSATSQLTIQNQFSDYASLGTELVSNGDFIGSATGWTLNGNWAYGSNQVTHTSGSADDLSQTLSGIAYQHFYEVTFDVSGMTTGYVAPKIGGTQGSRVYQDVSGQKQVIQNWQNANSDITFSTSGDFDGSVDNVSVKEISTSIPIATFLNNDDNRYGAALEFRTGGGNGLDNTFIGRNAGASNQTGNNSTAVGVYSYESNLSGYDNAAFGYFSLYANTTGIENTAIGNYTLMHNISGSENTALGLNSLQGNTTGSNNSAFGNESLRSNTTGTLNSAFGYQALYNNTTGVSNNAFGNVALYSNTTGTYNNAFGGRSLQSNTTGDFNNAFGDYALNSNISGSYNNAFGDSALASNISGWGNNAFGESALYSLTTGNDNSAFGDAALTELTTGEENSGFGENALKNTTAGWYNSAIGENALWTNTTGFSNTALGAFSDVGQQNLVNATAVGANAYVTQSNSLVLGSINGINGATASANVGIGVTAPSSKLQISNENDVTLGNELTTDGDFSLDPSSNGWNLGDCASWGGSDVTVTYTSCTNPNLSTDIPITTGRYYQLTFTLSGITGSGASFYFDNNSYSSQLYGNGTHTVVFPSTYTGLDTIFFDDWDYNPGDAWTIDDVSIKEVSAPASLSVIGYDGSTFLSLGNDFANNTALGKSALSLNSGGYSNTAVGSQALFNNTTGFQNSAFGNVALFNNTTGNQNSAFGNSALYSNTTGSVNSAFGESSLYNNTTGLYNSAFGNSTLSNNTSGSNNSAFGALALINNSTGAQDNAFGVFSLFSNSTGAQNNAFGTSSLYNNSTGAQNNAFGDGALYNNTLGTSNIAMGGAAGFTNTVGGLNTFLGYASDVGLGHLVNATAIGANAYVTANNSLVLGSINGINGATASAKVGIGTTAPVDLLTLKGDNSEAILGSEKITNSDDRDFSTVTFNWTRSGINGLPWVIDVADSNKAVKDTPGVGSIDLNTPGIDSDPVPGHIYQISFDYTVDASSSGYISAYFGAGGDGVPIGINPGESGTNVSIIRANSNSPGLTIGAGLAGADWYGSVDNVSVKEITPTNSLATLLNSDGTTGVELRSGGSGLANTYLGYQAGYVNTTGNSNTGIGNSALLNNTTGFYNTAVGSCALCANTSGQLNNAFGNYALSQNTTGNSNNAFGGDALYHNNIGQSNNAFGDGALFDNTSGSNNNAFGDCALCENTTGNYNSAFGDSALESNTTGVSNNAFGSSALLSNTTGQYNSAFGESALSSNTTGINNSAFGRNALVNSILASENSAFGTFALQNNTSGNLNSAFGEWAGNTNTVGSLNTFLGYQADAGAGHLINATAIGANAYVTQDNSIVLGSINGINGATASAKVGIGTTAPQTQLHILTNGPEENAIRVEGNNNSYSSRINLKTPGSDGALVAFGSSYGSGILDGNIFLQSWADTVGLYSATSDVILATGTTATAGLTLKNNGLVGIGVDSPASELHVTRPLSYGASGKALVTFDQIENQDLFTASASGTPIFTVTRSGGISLGANGLNVGTGSQCITGGTTASWGSCGSGGSGATWWNQVGGLVYPTNSLYDFAVGGSATSSALFSYTGIKSGQTQASVSGNLIVIPNNGFGGRVGIGTTTPSEKLDVNGTGVFGNVTEKVSLSGGSLGFNRRVSDGLIYDSSGFGYQFQHTKSVTAGSDNLALQVYNTAGSIVTQSALVVDGNGNVGLGTPTINSANKLDVIGGALIIGSSDFGANASIHINAVYGGNGRLTQFNSASGGALNIMSGNNGTNWWSWGVNSSANWNISPGTNFGSSGLTIATNGNVGIGAAPSYLLDVAGDINWTGALRVAGNAGSTGDCLKSAGGSANTWGGCDSTAALTNWWNQVGGLVYPTNTNYDFAIGSSATSSALFSFTGIKSGQTVASVSGNLIVMPNNGFGGTVGIGSINPDISNQLYAEGAFGRIMVSSTTNSNNAGYRLKAKDSGGTAGTAGYYYVKGTTNATTYLGLSADDINYQLVVNKAGYTGIGTTNPVGELEVLSSSTSNVTRGITSTQVNSGAQAAQINFQKARGTVGSLSTVANNDYTGAFGFFNHDGTNYLETAAFGARVNGTVGTGSVPTDLFFATSGGASDNDPYGNNNVRLLISSVGRIGFNTTTPLSSLDIRGVSGTLAVASASGKTSFASLVANNNGVGDLFTASSSGNPQFTIKNNGQITTNAYTNCTLTTDNNGLINCGTGSGGAVSGVRVYNSANETVNNSNLTFDSEDYDTDNYHNTSSNTSRITIPSGKAGTYILTASIYDQTGSYDVRFNLNGSLLPGAQESGTVTTARNITRTVNLSVGDYVEVSVYTSGGTHTILGGNTDGANMSFSAVLLNGYTGVAVSPFTENSSLGYIAENISTEDLLLGGQSTASATFAVLNNSLSRGNQIASLSGSLTLDSATSAIQSTNKQTLAIGGNTTGNIKFDTTGNFLFYKNGSAFSCSGTDKLTLDTSGLLNCSADQTGGGSGTNWWNQVGGLVYPTNTNYDFAVGGSATTSALFSYTGIKSGQTVASVSGNLIVMANNGYGGRVSVGATDPTSIESYSRLTVQGSDSTALYSSVINTGSGQVGFALNRTGTIPSRWVQYIPSGSSDLRFYNNGDIVTFQAGGNVGIGTNTPLGLLSVNGSTTSTQGQALVQINQTSSGAIFTASQAGNTKFLIDNSGNVGIGTTNPTSFLHIVGTLSSTIEDGVYFNITSSNTATAPNRSAHIDLQAGYTGSSATQSLSVNNYVAGTGSNLGGVAVATANYGVIQASRGTTTGTNVGAYGWSGNGLRNVGVVGDATFQQTNNASALSLGVYGIALRNTAGTEVGGYFGLQSSEPTFVSAALIADNGAESAPIFIARNNGTEKLRIDSGGNLGIGTITPASALSVTRPLSFGATGKALVTIDQIENQDILTASKSGATKFVIDSSGNLKLASGTTLDTLTSGTLGIGTTNATTLTLGRTGQTINTPAYQGCLLTTDSSGNVACGQPAASAAASLIAYNYYRPSSQQNYATTSVPLVDLDSTNLSVTFTVPASGQVLIKIGAAGYNTSSEGWGQFGLREGSTAVASSRVILRSAGGVQAAASFLITGLTPGTTHTYKFAYSAPGGGTTNVYVKWNPGSDDASIGPAYLEVWDPSPATTALASSKTTITSGDISTNSTSFVDVTGASLTITTGARRVLVTANGITQNNTIATNYFDVSIDGNQVGGTDGLEANSLNTGYIDSINISYLTDILTAGTHTFKIRWKVNGSSTGTIRASSTTPFVFAVQEVADTQLASNSNGVNSPFLQNDTTGSINALNSTVDLLLGGSASSSAKFGFLNTAQARGNQIASFSGSLTLDSATSAIQSTNKQTLAIGGSTTGNIKLDTTGNFLFYKNGSAFSCSGTDKLTLDTSGLLNCSADQTGSAGVNWWNQVGGLLYPTDTNYDFALGSSATTSALFSFTGIKSGNTIASISGNLIVNANNGYGGSASLSAGLVLGSQTSSGIQSTNNRDLTIGGNTTGNIFLNPQNSTGTVFVNSNNATSLGALNITQAGTNTYGIVFGVSNNSGITPIKVLIGLSSGRVIDADPQSFTSGSLLYAVANSGNQYNNALTGNLIDISLTRTKNGTTNVTDTGNFLRLNRVNTVNATATWNITGDLANLSSNCTISSGNCVDTSNILRLTQNFGLATGAVFNLVNNGVGSGAAILSNSGGQAAFILNKTGSAGDIFTASSSGTKKFAIGINGNLELAGGQTSDIDTFTATTLNIAASTANAITLGNSTVASTTFNVDTAGNFVFQKEGSAFSCSGTDKLTLDGSGNLVCSADQTGGGSGVNWFNQVGGLVYPTNTTYDFAVGGSATASALFSFTGLKTGNTIASISGNLIVNANNGYGGSASVSAGLVLGADSAATVQSTNNKGLTFGGNSTGEIIFSPNNGTGKVTIGSTTNGLVFDISNGGPTYYGNSRPSKQIVLSPEYAGAVLTASGSATSIGSMTSDASPSANFRTYYEWSSTQNALQDYTVAIRVTLPADFGSWNNSTSLQISYNTDSNVAATNKVDVFVYNPSFSTSTPAVLRQGLNSTSWTTADIADTQLSNWNTAGQTATIYLKMYASGSVNKARIGDIILNYKAKF